MPFVGEPPFAVLVEPRAAEGHTHSLLAEQSAEGDEKERAEAM